MPAWVSESQGIAEMRDQLAIMAAELTVARESSATLQESLADLELAAEDRGWVMLHLQADRDFTDAGRKAIADNCEITLAANPLAKQGVRLRTAYIWGQGVSISVDDKDPETEGIEAQDVNTIVQDFLTLNRDVISGAMAHEEIEQQCATVGELFFCLVTDRLRGQVNVRKIEPDEITEIVANPEDAQEVWFYKRVFTTQQIGSTRYQTITRYYPSWDYNPRGVDRLKLIDGDQVMWDQPIRAVILNKPRRRSKRGMGDLYSALPWIRASKEVLEAWVTLFKALARFAYKTTAKDDRTQKVADEMRTAAQASKPTGNPTGVGATYVGGTNAGIEAVSKSGALIDANGARPVQMMISAALSVPITMLLGDPGITGSRATAETLDEPTGLIFTMRRDIHREWLTDVIDYRIDWAIKTGELKGSVSYDGTREIATLAGEQSREVLIIFPDYDSTPVVDKVAAVVNGAGEEVMPKALVLRLILEALKVRNIEEIMDANTDEDGVWIDTDHEAEQTRDDHGGQTGVVPPEDEEPDVDQSADSGSGTQGSDQG